MFRDIKVGDKVLHVVKARDEEWAISCFFVPVTVKKVTKTRVKTEYGTYKKSNGEDCNCPDWGDLTFITTYSKEKDQLEEYKKFLHLTESIMETKKKVKSLEVKIKRNCSIETIEEIYSFCDSMIKKLSDGVTK